MKVYLKRCTLLFAFTCWLYLVGFHLVMIWTRPQKFGVWKGEAFGDHNRTLGANRRHLKTILLWDHVENPVGVGQAPFVGWKCKVPTCQITRDQTVVPTADAVIFEGPDVGVFPTVRPPGQVYVLMQEKPYHKRSKSLFPSYRGKFNLTMTYRRRSDIVLNTGRVLHSPTRRRAQEYVNSTSRSAKVAVLMRSCESSGKRELYIKELARYIDVHVYGRCGKYRCREPMFRCMKKLEKTYSFYLAFERSYCKDYVEKVYKPLMTNMVPVVYGHADYSQIAPPHSVIDVKDYPNPRDLALHLHNLASDKERYNEHFHWRSSGYRIEHYRKTLVADAFCRLCAIVNNPFYKYRNYEDIATWWNHDACYTDHMAMMQKKWTATAAHAQV